MNVAVLVAMALVMRVVGVDHSLHIVFSTECTEYFDWQSVGMFWSIFHTYRAAGEEPPPTTRLTACDSPSKVLTAIHTPGWWPAYHKNFNTHVHPRYNIGQCPPDAPPTHCNNTDNYSAYNKPGSVAHWLEHGDHHDDTRFVIFLDADQVVRRVIDPVVLGAREGVAVSAHYGYLRGTDPHVHMGVKADIVKKGLNKAPFEQVGGFFIHHINDLRRVAPLWLHYTQRVRSDPDSWANTGDVYNCPKPAFPGCAGVQCRCPNAPWISEMYGYVFGASVAGITHVVDNNILLYPGYEARHLKEPYPLVMHYGLQYLIDLGKGKGYWAFDKHWYRDADGLLACTQPHHILRQPPPPNLVMSASSPMTLRTREMVLFTAWALANATQDFLQSKCSVPGQFLIPFEDQHPYRCSASQGTTTCEVAETGSYGGGHGWMGDPEGGHSACDDRNKFCCDWAARGECSTNAGYMEQTCRKACGLCGPSPCRQTTVPFRAQLPAFTANVVSLGGWLVALCMCLLKASPFKRNTK